MVRRRSRTKSNKRSRKRSNKQIKKKSRRRSKKKINRKSNRKSKRRSRKTLRKKSKKTIKLKGGDGGDGDVQVERVVNADDAFDQQWADGLKKADDGGNLFDLTGDDADGMGSEPADAAAAAPKAEKAAKPRAYAAKKKKKKSKKGFSPKKGDTGASLCDGTPHGRKSWYYEKTSKKDGASDNHEFKGQRVCCPPGAKRDNEACVPVPTRKSSRR